MTTSLDFLTTSLVIEELMTTVEVDPTIIGVSWWLMMASCCSVASSGCGSYVGLAGYLLNKASLKIGGFLYYFIKHNWTQESSRPHGRAERCKHSTDGASKRATTILNN